MVSPCPAPSPLCPCADAVNRGCLGIEAAHNTLSAFILRDLVVLVSFVPVPLPNPRQVDPSAPLPPPSGTLTPPKTSPDDGVDDSPFLLR